MGRQLISAAFDSVADAVRGPCSGLESSNRSRAQSVMGISGIKDEVPAKFLCQMPLKSGKSPTLIYYFPLVFQFGEKNSAFLRLAVWQH